jgi:hypothetical protein
VAAAMIAVAVGVVSVLGIRAMSRYIERVRRLTDIDISTVDLPEAPSQRGCHPRGGRNRTRTCDLSRVKAAL